MFFNAMACLTAIVSWIIFYLSLHPTTSSIKKFSFDTILYSGCIALISTSLLSWPLLGDGNIWFMGVLFVATVVYAWTTWWRQLA